MHINNTSNTNNIYSVEVIHDENVLNTLRVQTTGAGTDFYNFKIIPNDYSQLMCAGNFKIDGLSSSWVYNATVHSFHPSKCYPQNPPWYGTGVGQHVKHSTAHSYVLKGEGNFPGFTGGPPNTPGLNIPCWGPNSLTGQNFTGNGTYRFNGPFVFDNSAYCDGAFLTSTEPVTWRKIVLVDMYEEDNGNIRSGASGDLDNTENWIQMIWPPQMNQYTNPPTPAYTLNPNHNSYPAHVKAWIVPEYHPTNPKEENMSINLDIDYVAPVGGCTDQGADNYQSTADFNDGSCTYPPPVTYTITISDSGTAGGPYTNEYLNNTFSGPAPAKNLVFNGGNPFVLANTYQAGDVVTEYIQIDLTPQLDQNGNIAVFDFPIAGGPNPNITQTLGYTNQGTQWGDAKNNLTAASIRINNVGDPSIRRVGSLHDPNNNVLSEWHNSPDPTGYQPEKLYTFDDNPGNGTFTAKIITTDASGNPLDIPTGTTDPASTASGVGVLEFNYSSGDPEVTAQPALEYFPYKLWLLINIKDFVMPAENVNIAVDIEHNTENQGDPNWSYTPPVSGCTDPSANNYDPLATVDDGTCTYGILGCTNQYAQNYDPNATVDDGSCTYAPGWGPTGYTGGGGKIVCSMMNEFYGTPPTMNKVWLKHSANMENKDIYASGYHAIFLPLVNFAKKEGSINYVVRKVLEEIAISRTKDLQAEMENTKRHFRGRVYRFILEPICYLVGLIKSK